MKDKFEDLNNFNFIKNEKDLMAFWENNNVFKKSINQRRKNKLDNFYSFYDGPPFATGLPHYGHLLTSIIKDIIARYWTMKGRYVERRFGWDTHGLPVEMEAEKKLKLSGPKEIQHYGIGKFNEFCRSMVLKYSINWKDTITRIGRWVDFDNSYKTMDLEFMESTWWVFSKLWKNNLVYRDFKVMPYSCRLSTGISNFEANLNYKNIQSPAITVKFDLKNNMDKFSLLIWTTTPWTLPSNSGIAVGENIKYVKILNYSDGKKYIIAKKRILDVIGDNIKIISIFRGKALLKEKYKPVFNYFGKSIKNNAFTIILSSHVKDNSGTGLVHISPLFGEDDYKLSREKNLPLFESIDSSGFFLKKINDFAYTNILKSNNKIIKFLKEKKLIFKHEVIQHQYPFCWRSDTPLIYKAIPAWVLKVSKLKHRMIELNKKINWIPSSVGRRRFNNWLKNAQDWTISRNRFWGTPIPIWKCNSCNVYICINSVNHFTKESKNCIENIKDIHSHYLDKWIIFCKKCQGKTSRIKEVFDCWFESGSMPYAQLHYPFKNNALFKKTFPAKFVVEGLDQTRGWFYTLMILSTALFSKEPFANVIVNGLILASDGIKMSKSKKNYPKAINILNKYGADALRVYLVNSPVSYGESLLFNENGVREAIKVVLLPIFHSFLFFFEYSKVDFIQKKSLELRNKNNSFKKLDKWIISKLNTFISRIDLNFKKFYLYKLISIIVEFIDDLSNFYIRLNRRRFWKKTRSNNGFKDKNAAYCTLYYVLRKLSVTLAPIIPFLSETIFKHLSLKHEKISVHLCDYFKCERNKVNLLLEKEIFNVKLLIKLGRILREKYKLRIKQPLNDLIIVIYQKHLKKIILRNKKILCLELNVKNICNIYEKNTLFNFIFLPNFKKLGSIYKYDIKKASFLIEKISTKNYEALKEGKKIKILNKFISLKDLIIKKKCKRNILTDESCSFGVYFNFKISFILKLEWMMRELISILQKARKNLFFEINNKIIIFIFIKEKRLYLSIRKYINYIKEETLALSVNIKNKCNNNYAKENIENLNISILIIRFFQRNEFN